MLMANENVSVESEFAPDAIDVTGVPVVPFESYDQALRHVERVIESRGKTFWVAINPQKCFRAWHERELLSVLKQADVGICDGVGVSIAAKILYGKGIKRVTGCDMFFRLLPRAAEKGWGVFMLGASPESNARARENLVERFPGLRIVGSQDGYFEDSAEVVKQINATGADLLFVAMGSPKQEYWIWRHRDQIDAAFCMGVGGSFDVASGAIRRAPMIFQKTGTEFLFQLITEPRARWKRQKVYFPYMLKILGSKLLGSSISPEVEIRQTTQRA